MVTHPGTNRARRVLTSFIRRTPLTTTPRRQLTWVVWDKGPLGVRVCVVYCSSLSILCVFGVVVQSSEEIESYINQVETRRSAEDFSDNVCRLLLPSGQYQHVDVLRPHQLYQTCVFL